MASQVLWHMPLILAREAEVRTPWVQGQAGQQSLEQQGLQREPCLKNQKKKMLAILYQSCSHLDFLSVLLNFYTDVYLTLQCKASLLIFLIKQN